MNRGVAYDRAGAGRLTLALGLALSLHAALLFGVAVDWRSFHPPAPRQFEVRLLPAVSPKPVAPMIAAVSELEPAAVSEPEHAAATPETIETVVAPPDPPSAVPAPPASLPVSAPVPISPPAAKLAATPALKPSSKVTTAPATAPKIIKRSPPSRSPVKPKPATESAPARAKSSAETEAPTPTRPVPAVRSAAASVSPAQLDSTALLGQIARLDTETSRRTNADIRSKRVSPSDTQSPEGFYIAAWLRKVEQIGETNFPEVARRLNLSIGPVLDVAIGADGALREVRVARSSGNAELDQAAQKIVRLGAPYAPFPPGLRQKWDVLRIARPWRFDASGQLQVR